MRGIALSGQHHGFDSTNNGFNARIRPTDSTRRFNQRIQPTDSTLAILRCWWFWLYTLVLHVIVFCSNNLRFTDGSFVAMTWQKLHTSSLACFWTCCLFTQHTLHMAPKHNWDSTKWQKMQVLTEQHDRVLKQGEVAEDWGSGEGPSPNYSSVTWPPACARLKITWLDWADDWYTWYQLALLLVVYDL